MSFEWMIVPDRHQGRDVAAITKNLMIFAIDPARTCYPGKHGRHIQFTVLQKPSCRVNSWVMLYASLASLDASVVARAIATTFLSNPLDDRLLVLFGIAIHFALSIGLALAFACAISGWLPRQAVIVAALAALAAVWAVNFLILLPVANSSFVTLLPAPVSLSSKLLFGVAMGWTILRLSHRARRPR